MAPSLSDGIGWLRVAVGVVLGAAPRRFLRGSTGEEPSGALIFFARTVGIRDLVIGAGTISALRSDKTSEVRRWIAIGLMSDLLDAVASISSARLVGKRGALIATGVTLPVIAAYIWSLTHLERSQVGAPWPGT
jgi:hypothetical protein